MKFVKGSVNKLGEVVVLGDGLALDEDADGRPQLSSTATGGASTLDELTDVAISTPTTAQVLRYNGSSWANTALAAADIASGTLATARLGSGSATSSTFLRGDSTWVTLGAGVSALDDLSDVIITTPSTAQVLRHNGSSWVNATLAYADLSGKPTTLAGYGITDAAPIGASYIVQTADGSLTSEFALGSLATGLLSVTTTTGALTSVNAANRVPTAYLGSGTANSSSYLRGDQTWATIPGGVSALDDLSDVVITTAATAQVLRYNGSSWVNVALAFADLSGKPTTLAGYGITDGALNTITISTTAPLTGGGNLTSNRTFAISSNGIDNTLLRQGTALSVIGRSANSTGNVADIAAAVDGDVLRRSGTTLGFGAIPQASVTSLVSDLALKAPLASPTFTGTPAAPTATGGTNTTQIATTAFVTSAISTASGGYVPTTRTISTTAPIAGGGDLSTNRTFSLNTNGITNALFRQSTALTVVGRSANSTGDVADISAGADGDVLRRSGTTLGFGAIPQTSVTSLVSDLALKAPLASPVFTGTPMVGYNALHVLDITHVGTPTNGMRIVTTIPHDGVARGMFSVHFRGYDLENAGPNTGQVVDFTVGWYQYSTGVYHAMLSNRGSYNPTIQMGEYGGYVAFFITNTRYYPALHLSASHNGYLTPPQSYFQGWSSSDADTTGATGLVTPTKLNAFDTVAVNTQLSVGTTPATAGLVRFPNNSYLAFRNAGNTANLVGMHATTSDNLIIGGSGVAAIIHYATNYHRFFDPAGSQEWGRIAPNYAKFGYDSQAADEILYLTAAAAYNKSIHFCSGGSAAANLRWLLRANNAAESGSNAGTNFELQARTDAGAPIDTPIAITRAAGGMMTIARPLTVSANVTIGSLGTIDSTVAPTTNQMLVYDSGTSLWKPKTVNFSMITAGEVTAATGPNGTSVNYFDDLAARVTGTATTPGAAPVLTPIYKGVIADLSAHTLPADCTYVLQYSTDNATWFTVTERATAGKVIHSDLPTATLYYYRFTTHGTGYATYSASASTTTLSVPEVSALGIIIASQLSVAKLSAIAAATSALTAETLTVTGALTANGSLVSRNFQSSTTGSYGALVNSVLCTGPTLTLKGLVDETNGSTTAAVLGNHSVSVGGLTARSATAIPVSWSNNSPSVSTGINTTVIATDQPSITPNSFLPSYNNQYTVTGSFACTDTLVHNGSYFELYAEVILDYVVNGAGGYVTYGVVASSGAPFSSTNWSATITVPGVTSSLECRLTYRLTSTTNATKINSGDAVLSGSGTNVSWSQSGGTAYTRRSLYLAADTSKPQLTLQPLTGTMPTTSNTVPGEFWYDGTNNQLSFNANAQVVSLGLGKLAAGPTSQTLTISNPVTVGYELTCAQGTATVAPFRIPALSAFLTSPTAGVMEVDSRVQYFTTVNSQRMLTPNMSFALASSAITKSNVNTAQSVFTGAYDVLTVNASTTYFVEGHYMWTSGTTSHTIGIGFSLATATVTAMNLFTIGNPQVAGTSATTSSHTNVTSTANTTVVAASTTGGGSVWFSGYMIIGTGGTITPQFTFSAAPGGTPTVAAGSYIKFTPIGSSSVTQVTGSAWA